jgi:hypothetical protein
MLAPISSSSMRISQNDRLQRYLASLDELRTEKAELESRLEKINEALAGSPAARRGGRGRGVGKRAGGGRRRRNGLSLRAAVVQATKSRPLAKTEILEAVRKLGYKFATKDPMNSLNAMLYAPANKFRNQDGKFSPK